MFPVGSVGMGEQLRTGVSLLNEKCAVQCLIFSLVYCQASVEEPWGHEDEKYATFSSRRLQPSQRDRTGKKT